MSKGRVFKRCGCRDEAGRQYGQGCPQLEQRGHGAYAYVVDLPTPDGARRQASKGGFRTKKGAEAAMVDRANVGKLGVQVDPKISVGRWLDLWLADKASPSGVSASGKTIRRTTATSYRHLIATYLKPHLGGLLLNALTPEDVSHAYRTILADAAAKSAAIVELRMLESEERVKDGLAPKDYAPVRVAGATTLRRVHATLHAALQAAVKGRRIPYNPAAGVTLPEAPKGQVRPWEPKELGQFLDHVQGHRLGGLFETIASCGLRRGEALGLRWADVDAQGRKVTIRQQLLNLREDGAPVFGKPKTAAGDRVVELDGGTVGALVLLKLGQDAERAQWGPAYEDHGLVFCQVNGRHHDPARISKAFVQLADAAGVRRVRLHDLRHGSASLMMAAGVPIEIVSKRLGHSSRAITHELYSHLLDGVGRQAAEAGMALVPRAHARGGETEREHNVSTTPRNHEEAPID